MTYSCRINTSQCQSIDGSCIRCKNSRSAALGTFLLACFSWLSVWAGCPWSTLPARSPSTSFRPALVAALGMSLAFIPTLGTAISAARPEEGGLASGIVNPSYQIGSALGLAVMTAVAASNGADKIGNPVALTEGYSAAFIGAALVAAVGAATAAAFLRRPDTTKGAPVDQFA